jgi:hypothetical protein
VTDIAARIRAISPRRLELLERRLRAVRPAEKARETADVWVRWHGVLDAFDVQRALDDIARNHAVPPELVLRLVDVSDLPPGEAEAEAVRRFACAGHVPRAVLFRLTRNAYALALAAGEAGVDAAALRAAVDDVRARGAPAARTESPAELLARVDALSDADVDALSDADVDAALAHMQAAGAPPPPVDVDALADVDALSDDEVDALLRAMGTAHA